MCFKRNHDVTLALSLYKQKIICISLSLSLSLNLNLFFFLLFLYSILNKIDFKSWCNHFISIPFYLHFLNTLCSVSMTFYHHESEQKCIFALDQIWRAQNVWLWTPTARDMIEWFSIFVACTSYVLKMNKCHIQLNTIRENKQNIRCIPKTHIHLLPQFLVINFKKCLACFYITHISQS